MFVVLVLTRTRVCCTCYTIRDTHAGRGYIIPQPSAFASEEEEEEEEGDEATDEDTVTEATTGGHVVPVDGLWKDQDVAKAHTL